MSLLARLELGEPSCFEYSKLRSEKIQESRSDPSFSEEVPQDLGQLVLAVINKVGNGIHSIFPFQHLILSITAITICI